MSQTEPGMMHTDSIDSQDPHNDSEKKAKSRRPGNTAFRQQRLKAWQPILTPKSVIPLFFAIGIIFAPIGGALLFASAQVQELVLDYTKCGTDAPEGTFGTMPSDLISAHFKNGTSSPQASWKRVNSTYNYGPRAEAVQTWRCSIQVDVPADMTAPVLFYYQLTNFYQNHRRYVKSYDTDQLSGTAVTNSTIKGSACDPLTVDANGKAYYPCGLIANSIFNDTFYNPVLLNPSSTSDANVTYIMQNNSGVAWSSDAALYGQTKYTPDQVSPPPNWVKRWPNGYTEDHPPPNLHTDEAFQVWMRTAGLPTFSKLYQRNDTATLTAGTYEFVVDDNFNVTVYGGTKSIILSTRTVIGGKNPFLGIAYIVVGGVCLILGTIFLVTRFLKPRKLGDHTYLSWNNETTATAAATGRDTQSAAGNSGLASRDGHIRPDL